MGNVVGDEDTSRSIERLVRGRRVAPVVALAASLVVLMGVVAVAASPPNVARVRALPQPQRLDYGSDPPGRIRRLSDTFVAQTLGEAASVVAPAVRPAIAAPAGIRPVSPVVTPNYRCVNGHQTEDPLSPPCVGSFKGDNGGGTWRGVTGSEIRLLVYLYPSGNYPCDSSRPTCGTYPRYGTYVDLETPPSATEDLQVTALRLLQRYFDSRYQTYGRRVHVFAYFGEPSPAATPLERFVEEADENRLFVNPFAVVRAERSGYGSLPPPAAAEVYEEELAKHQIASFELNSTRPSTFSDQYPGLIWSYRPSLEQLAALYSSFACQKIVNQPVVLSGNPGQNGRPRHLAMMHVSGPGYEKYEQLAVLITREVTACGGRIEAELSYPIGAASCDGEYFVPVPGTPDGSGDPELEVSKLKARGITTVLWPGCLIDRMTLAVAGWPVELVFLDTGTLNSNTFSDQAAAALGGPTVNAVLVTPKPFTPALDRAVCATALREADPEGTATPVYLAGCPLYPLLRQAFTAIQLAGPDLTPQHMAGAEQSQPSVAVAPPEAPPCRYQTGNFSCLPDAQVETWRFGTVDPGGNLPVIYPRFLYSGSDRSLIGCWASIQGGKRYLPWHWPAGNINAQITGSEACNDPSAIDE